jgi:predicted NBD/HSP70 family sugar kinase
MDETMTPESLTDHVARLMRAFLKDHGIEPGRILGVGIGAVGPLDRRSGVILDPLYFPSKGWTQTPICRMLEEKTGFRAMLENGANTALMGERWAAGGDNIQHALYIHTGTTLRSAMMSYGQIIHGTVDMEGAIGQMIVNTDGSRLHAAGNYGALEAYASVRALEMRARAQLKMGAFALSPSWPANPEQLDFDILVQALSEGDSAVREWFRESAVYFGVGLANLINVFHPEIIFLGGALVNAHPMVFETATETARRNTYYFPAYEPRFSRGRLKEDAVVTGAALMVRGGMEL